MMISKNTTISVRFAHYIPVLNNKLVVRSIGKKHINTITNR